MFHNVEFQQQFSSCQSKLNSLAKHIEPIYTDQYMEQNGSFDIMCGGSVSNVHSFDFFLSYVCIFYPYSIQW